MTVLVNPYIHAHVWVPTDVSGIIGWWDASDAASITSSSGAISQWNDKSGNGNHLSQSSAGLKPTLTTDGTTGKGSVVFDGGDVLAAASSASLQPTTGASWFMAGYFGTSGYGSKYIFTKDGGGWNGWIIYTHSAGSYIEVDINGAAEYQMINHSWIGRQQLSALYDKSNLYGRRNGVATASGAYSANISTNSSSLYVGARDASATSGTAFTAFEIIYYNNHVGNTNRDVIEAYLKAKWSTT